MINKCHAITARLSLGLYELVENCMKTNGYTLVFMVRVGLIMFLRASHSERIIAHESSKPKKKRK